MQRRTQCHALLFLAYEQIYEFIIIEIALHQKAARMYISSHLAQIEALRRRAPQTAYMQKQGDNSIISNILQRTASIIKRSDSAIHRRSGSAAHTNLIIGLVVGFTLAAFIIGVCVFICCYGDSIRFSKKKHGHRRRSTSSKGSRHSKAKEGEHAEGAAEGA